MEKLSGSNLSKKNLLLKNIFNADFIISAIIPIVIFSFFDKYGMTLYGIILSGVWSIGVVGIVLIKERHINALAAISASFAGIGVVGSVISKNPSFYLVSPIVQDVLLAIIFFGSLVLKRSLIQVVVEQSYLKDLSEERKNQPGYKKIWMTLTIAFGILSVSQAVLRTILLYSVSMSSYYAISTLYNNISTPVLIAFSILFSHYHLKRGK